MSYFAAFCLEMDTELFNEISVFLGQYNPVGYRVTEA